MQENAIPPSVATDSRAQDCNVQPLQSHYETQNLSPALISVSDVSSVSRDISSNMSMSPSSSFSTDYVPRPSNPMQRSISSRDIELQVSNDPARSGFIGRSATIAFNANNVSEEPPESRQRSFTAPMINTPINEAAGSSRLLQALPQLGIGHFLQSFTTQIPPWRGFSTGRQDSEEVIEEIEETGRLLTRQEGFEEEGGDVIVQSQRQGTSETPIDLMSSSGNFQRSENASHSVIGERMQPTETTLTSTVRVENDSTRERRDSEESDDQTAMDELQALFRRCHNSLPFVALFLIYFAYQHAIGILVFVVGTAAVMGLDQRMRAQVALKDKASTWHLLSIITMCAIDMVAICSVEGEPNPVYHFPQVLQLKANHDSDSESKLLSTGGIFWQVLWTVLVNGTCSTLVSLQLKMLTGIFVEIPFRFPDSTMECRCKSVSSWRKI